MEIKTDLHKKTRLKWDNLLSTYSINTTNNIETLSITATELFDRELGIIVNSDLFRRMEDKTQVFAYRGEGKARTRLTHSVEAMHIALEIGRKVQKALSKAFSEKISYLESLKDETKNKFINSLKKEWNSIQYLHLVLRNALLIHDIGNPPFGHKGEDLISDWLVKNINNFQIDTKSHEFSKVGSVYHKTKESTPVSLRQAIDVADDEKSNYLRDIVHFEGNAQSLRIITKLMYPSNYGISIATMSAIMKYTCLFTESKKTSGLNYLKKTGYFYSEKEIVDTIKRIVGTNKRNPTAFLVEGADDTAYALCDLDDCIKNGFISFEGFFDHLYQYYLIYNRKSDLILESKKEDDIKNHDRQKFLKQKRKELIVDIANLYLPDFVDYKLSYESSEDDIKRAFDNLSSRIKCDDFVKTLVEPQIKHFNKLSKDNKNSIPKNIVYKDAEYKALFNGGFYKTHSWRSNELYEKLREYLRDKMIDSICDCFDYYYDDIIYDLADRLILTDTSFCDFIFESIHCLMKANVYKSDKVRENEVTEYKIINTLMTKLIKAIFNKDVKDELKDETYNQFDVYCSQRYSFVTNKEMKKTQSNSISIYAYYHLRCLIDNICGMSDGHALRIYKKIQGIVDE